jgi:hypothetical protein
MAQRRISAQYVDGAVSQGVSFLANDPPSDPSERVRMGHAAGTMTVGAVVTHGSQGWQVGKAVMSRPARPGRRIRWRYDSMMRARAWIAVFGLAILSVAGCGGGAGGLRPIAPVAGTYPGLANITAPTTLASVATSATEDTVAIQATPAAPAGTVQIDWSNTTVRVRVTGVAGQSFDQSFALGSLNLTTITAGVSVLEGTVFPLAGDNRSISLTPIGGGPPSFDHTVLGRWNYTSPSGTTLVVGYFVAGTQTRVADIPITGTASYSGRLLGNLYDSVSVARVSASASGTFDFGAPTPTLTFSTTGSRLLRPATGAPISDTADPTLDIPSTNLLLTAGTNNLTGTLSTSALRNLSGPVNAKCYGPACKEVGGVFSLSNPGNTQQMIGGFQLSQ